MDPMWGRSGPVAGGAWLGGHGKLCSRLRRHCVLHKTINISLEICINVLNMSIFHWKYVQFTTGRKFSKNVNMSLEICAKSVTSDQQMLIFHLKYV